MKRETPQIEVAEGTNRLTYHNLVTNEDIYEWVVDHLCPMLTAVREDRVVEEDRWMAFWRIWNVELDDQSYQGRSRVYLPAGRRALETWKLGLLQGLFPYSNQFDCESKHSSGLAGNAMALKALLVEFMKQMSLRVVFEEFLQQYETYGSGVLRLSWVDDEQIERFYERDSGEAPEGTRVIRVESEVGDEDLSFTTRKGTKVRLVERAVKRFYGPQLRCVDLMHFYVSPTTARNVEEAELAFEDMTISLDYLEAQSKKRMDIDHPDQGYLFESVQEILDTDGGRMPLDIEEKDRLRREREGMEQDENVLFGELDQGFVNLSDIRWRGEIPGAKDPYTGEEYGVIDWKVQIVNDTWPVAIYPNPDYKKRRPWLMGRMIHVVNEVYGRGLVEPFASLQYMLNDLGNLTIDNLVLALNPIVLVDDELVHDMDSLQLAPGAKWFLEKGGAEFIQPQTVSQLGMTTINMMQGFIQDASGANFVSQGTPAPQGRGRSQNSASGMALLQQSGSAGFNSAMESLQEEVMVPLLRRMYEMIEQFMTEKRIITLGGSDGIPLIEREVGFEDVIGSYQFKWLGAQAARERQGLMQGIVSFVQMLAQVRAVDPDAQSQFRIKWGNLAKRALTEGLGLSWADEVIETPDDQQSVDPTLENDLLGEQRFMPISPADNDDQHIAVHQSVAGEQPFIGDPIAESLRAQHQAKHEESKAQKQAQQQMQQMMEMAQAAQGGGPGGPPGMASPPGPGGSGGPAQQAKAQTQPSGVPNA